MHADGRRRSTGLSGSVRFVVAQAKYSTAALTRHSLRLLLIGYFGYCLARKASRVAIVVYAFDAGGVRAAAIVAIAQMFPASILAPIGAAFADRFDPARVLALGYVVQGVSLAATGYLMVMGASLGVVTLTSAIAASAFAVTRPVYLATLPDVVDFPDELTLGNAGSAWVDGLASVIGPLLAGIGLVVVGGGEVMLGLGVVCLLSAIVSLRLVVHRIVRGAHTSIRDLVLGGLTAIRQDRQVAHLVWLTAVQYVVVGLLDVLLVVFVVDVAGSESAYAGMLAAAMGVGSTLGGLGSVVLAGRPRLGPAVVAGAMVSGLPVMLLGVGPGLIVAATFLVGYGVGKSLVTVATQTLLHRTVSDNVAGRVFGVQEGVIQAAMACGALLGPFLVLTVGPRGALVATGVLLPVVAVFSRSPCAASTPAPSCPARCSASCIRCRSCPCFRFARSSSSPGRPKCARSRPTPTSSPRGTRATYYVIAEGSADVVTDGRLIRRLHRGDGLGRSRCCGTCRGRQRCGPSGRPASSPSTGTPSSQRSPAARPPTRPPACRRRSSRRRDGCRGRCRPGIAQRLNRACPAVRRVTCRRGCPVAWWRSRRDARSRPRPAQGP